MKKQRIYGMCELPGFDAYTVTERWIIGNKWYEKKTTQFVPRGTLEEESVTVECTVFNTKDYSLLWTRNDVYCEDGTSYSLMDLYRKIK